LNLFISQILITFKYFKQVLGSFTTVY